MMLWYSIVRTHRMIDPIVDAPHAGSSDDACTAAASNSAGHPPSSFCAILTCRWSQPVCHGEPPHPRHFHNTVFLGRRMYIYGGYDGNGW